MEGKAKARALAIAAIAGQDKEEIDDDGTTVSTHNLMHRSPTRTHTDPTRKT